MELSTGEVGFALFAGVLAVGVLALTGMEIYQWKRRRDLISGRQLTVRIIGGLMLTGLLAKILHGAIYMQPGEQPIRTILNFWAECVVLGWLLLFVVIVDLRLMMRVRRQKKEAIQRMAQNLLESFRAEHSQPEPPVQPEPTSEHVS